MHSDWFLKTGRNHMICEDYVLTNDNRLVVCDGCSGSENTNIGSMILAHLAINKDNINPNFLIAEANVHRKILGLKQTCLDSTILLAHKGINETIVLEAFGDGVFIYIDKNGNFGYDVIKYANNAPYYLSYRLNEERNQIYLSNLKNFDNLIIEEHDFDGDCIIDNKRYSFNHNDYVYLDEMSFIGISSDGLSSFVNYKTGEPIPLEKVIEQVTSFKNTNGKFIQRRMKRMIDDYEKQGIYHYDDISIAGFWIDDNGVPEK